MLTGSSYAALAAALPRLTRDYVRAGRSLHTVCAATGMLGS
jgi:hypothetical protein